MRITDHRYMRDTARLELAVRLIRLEARTRTIREWTGLTDDRIRKLYRSYLRDGSQPIKRHRGKSPQLASYFLRTHRALRHASALAALLSAFGALPPGGARPRGTSRLPLAALSGALVCDAYETYRSLLPDPDIGFEHAVFLATALAQGRELRLRHCGGCGSPVVSDGIALRAPLCERCGSHARTHLARAAQARALSVASRGPFSPNPPQPNPAH